MQEGRILKTDKPEKIPDLINVGYGSDLQISEVVEIIKDCLGYTGKSIIHPNQISVVHKLFHPNKSEISWAEKVCEIYLKSTKKGKGATTVDGKMIDEVHFKQAKALLEITK